MAIEKITMPQLGESVTEGTINSWLVKEGDHVTKYDPIADIMTDKVNAEVPSSFTGVIKEILVTEGETIAVGEVMCSIEIEGVGGIETRTEETIENDPVKNTEDDVTDQSMKKRYSPAVLKLAQESDIDLKVVNGTGRGGRITRKDIEKVIAEGSTEPKLNDVLKEKTNSSQFVTEEGDVEIPVTGVRKAVADNLVKSKTEIPHAWMTVEADVTELVRYRNNMKEDFKKNEGFNLTYFSFFVKAVAQALKEYPQLNSMWAGDKIIQRKDINVSIAVANEDDLFVPVIRDADEKSIKGIAKDINALAYKARTNKLTGEDMQGGTFTVNNTGSFGSIHSMGIINYPQAAILQVESIVKRPVIIDDMIGARDMVNLSLSLDHRILDGLVCGRFLARVKEILESINKENTEVY